MKQNPVLIYIYSILIKRTTMPIIILYFLLNNLNYTQIGILASTIAITTIFTEVHGGVFADIHGKKKSLILQSIFAFLTMIFYLGGSFYYFLIASICWINCGFIAIGSAAETTKIIPSINLILLIIVTIN